MVFKNYIKQLITSSILLVTFAIVPFSAWGQNAEERIIYHQNTIDAYTFPGVTEKIILKVLLLNTNDLNIPMTALITHDDQMTLVKPDTVFLNQFDQVEYHFNTYAPIAVLSYQFFTEDSNKKGLTSKVYTVKRNCRYPIADIDGEISNSIRGIERVQVVYEKTQGLEREVHAYDNAKKLINQILNELSLIKNN